MKEAIQKAIEGGYKDRHIWGIEDGKYILQGDAGERAGHLTEEQILLDPLFWQAVGKAMGWGGFDTKYLHSQAEVEASSQMPPNEWRDHWHRFIDHLAEGKDAESFFKELLK